MNKNTEVINLRISTIATNFNATMPLSEWAGMTDKEREEWVKDKAWEKLADGIRVRTYVDTTFPINPINLGLSR